MRPRRLPGIFEMGIRKIISAKIGCSKEPLRASFGFKGHSVDTLWNSVVSLTLDDSSRHIGLGVQSVLWADRDLFVRSGNQRGNEIMLSLTEAAISCLIGRQPVDPRLIQPDLYAACLSQAEHLSGDSCLQNTLILNALVPVDMALWKAYCHQENLTGFDQMIPPDCRRAFAYRHDQCANIPLVTYATSDQEIIDLAESGTPLFKIKLGQGTDYAGMLAWDLGRVRHMHRLLKDFRTPCTDSGRIGYYLDANGMYQNREDVVSLLEEMATCGALERLIVFEEPFPPENRTPVTGLPALFAADESASSITETDQRIKLGYRAIALKPIAKTISLSFEIARFCQEQNISCFCADLTVNPTMVDWNKNFAARLNLLPGMRVAVMETNGGLNYVNWISMKAMHPRPNAAWIDSRDGIFHLSPEFFATSGGVLLDYPAYAAFLP
jgi:L-alanine-DL-glutamate epimerase-like enolase superfamily enzyme